jgi:hypothetical protein
MLGSPVLPTTVNTGKTSQLCLVGQTVAKYFVTPVDCEAGGEGGIRTPDTLSGMPVFKTGAINHSATSPVIARLPGCGWALG